MTTPTLTTIHLVGALGQAVGRSEWNLDVKSVSEAVRAININTGGKLADYLSGPAAKHYYRIGLRSEENVIDPTEATHRSGRSTIFIMPAIKGRGDKGWVKALVGVALIALAFTGAAGLLGTSLQGFFAATQGVAVVGLNAVGVTTVGFGVSLLLGGISQLIAPKAQGNVTPEEQRASTTFPGNTTSVVQGGIIPVVYGRALVTPTPVSVTINNNDVSISNAGTVGDVDQTDLEGGGVQYEPS